MRSITISFCFLILSVLQINAQDPIINPYNPDADAKVQLSKAIEEAGASQKHILIMVGGNWCKWCIRLTRFMDEHYSIDSLIKSDFVYIHINYIKENKNNELMQQLEYPQRFGFPVLVILDSEGRRIHTQNSVYLEKDESYNEKVIKDFLLNWNYRALHPIE